MCDHMFVVTGGPGSGKSTLIEALHDRGFACMPEAGRAIIRDQVMIGGTALPGAEATGRVMADTYARLGYRLLELPKVSVEERVDFVMERLNAE